MNIENREQSPVTITGALPGCFLCASAEEHCDIPNLEGRIVEAYPGQSKSHDTRDTGHQVSPRISLKIGDGSMATVSLPYHTQPFIYLLAAIPPEILHTIHVRIHHLLHSSVETTESDTTESDTTHLSLRTSPMSALVLEPDHLLNITDINSAEYCVRQYPLRRMTPNPPNDATLSGNIIHVAFRSLLKGTDGSLKSLQQHFGQAVRPYLTDLALREIGPDSLEKAVSPHLEALAGWYARERSSIWGNSLQVRAETFLLAPEVGLKGRLDFLFHDEHGGSLLELKTGHVYADLPKREHRWQVHGYQTLLAARRPNDPARPSAMILYSGSPGGAESYRIAFSLRDLHHVLDLRNQLILVQVTGVVPPPPSPRKCTRCMLRTDCLLASQVLGWEAPLIDEKPKPVQPSDAKWFAEMYQLLRVESLATDVMRSTLWRETVEQRCENGHALGNLELVGTPRQTDSGDWEYSFLCQNHSELREGDEVLLSEGDPVTSAVVSGTILHLTDGGLTVWAHEYLLHPSLLDSYSSEIVHDRTLRNLWRWLEADGTWRSRVAGTRHPSFSSGQPLHDLPSYFNSEQREAIERSLAARDFFLVQGPPGTGKTKVVAEIARQAMLRGERVLVAAFTNQAVDNVLLQLIKMEVNDFVRLGHEFYLHPALRQNRLMEQAQKLTDGSPTSQHFREALGRAPLVASTTATWSAERYDDAGEPLSFDLAIVDEASQVTIPALVGALRFAPRFILVGDERQLPPLVVSEEAARLGLQRSLFRHLLDQWANVASVALRRQYRMHPLICEFPNATFYDGKLTTDESAEKTPLSILLPSGDPLNLVLAPEKPLIFIDVRAPHEPKGKISPAQAQIASKLATSLRALGIPAEDIGIIAPYRAQVAAIRQRLTTKEETSITVDTIDRFQGAERRVVLFSFGGQVPQQLQTHSSDFLADPNRLNVALTRAQQKLILIGDRSHLETIPVIARLIRYCATLYGGHGGIVMARVKSS